MNRLKEFELCYLATPYSRHPADIHDAFVAAASLAAWLMQRGVKVFSPIAHAHPIAMYGDIDPLDHTIWLPFDESMLKKSDALVVAMMESWEISKGIAHEIDHFIIAEKPIFYLEPCDLTIVSAVTSATIKRLAEINREISISGDWGAKLTALNEERKGILRNHPPLAHSKTYSEHAGTSE